MPSPPTTIRPVTKQLPDSKELWDDTNLPMCAVITPASGAMAPTKGKALASLPKCLHCGAPHATMQTHLRPSHEPILFCYLCGNTSSTLFEDQQEARDVAEVLESGIYDKDPAPAEGDVVVNLPLYIGVDDEEPPIPRLAAKACPPVWWIVLDASCHHHRSYWTTVGSLLENALQEIPDHVHVGIVAANATQLSTWDLTSDLPHVWHYPLSAPNMQLCLVPADAMFKSNILTAIRAIADAQPGTLSSAGKDDEEEVEDDGLGMALASALEVILEFMDAATHPGDDPDDSKAGNPQDDEIKLRYAGGKILCLLGNPPLEIASKPLESQPPYGPGGVAGSCSDVTQDKWEDPEDKPENEPTDFTPKNLKEFVVPLDPEDLFDVIGTKCANAALGVDLIIVVPEEIEPADEEYAVEVRPFYGLPLLSVLADTSGAPGPLMFGTRDESSVKALKIQLLARTPWQPDMIFGAQLRSRISPGFDLEDSPVEPVGRDKLQLAPFLSSGGLAGPAVMAEKGLWILGSCDAYTSVVVDYQVTEPNTVVTADGMGKVTMKPVLQICVAYTCVEKDAQGDYYTVRKLKISSVALPFTSDSEPLYDAMDPEALASVLYQKLVLNAYQEGLVAAQETAEIWLKSLLVCVYQSAQVEQAKIEELMEASKTSKGRRRKSAAQVLEEGSQMKASERLLDIAGGRLSEEEVLLGQGHAKIAVMPLIVFSLMQSDALRPCMGSYGPSMDARCAALTQMASMTPSSLSKCIAPSLQLWSTSKDEVLVESVDLNQIAIQEILKKYQALDTIFFLDSPQQILVYRTDQGIVSSETKSSSSLVLGPRLKAAIQLASNAYRTRPPIRYELQAQPFPKSSAMAFQNSLVEDNPTFSGMEDYEEWKAGIANQVKEELKKTGDIIS